MFLIVLPTQCYLSRQGHRGVMLPGTLYFSESEHFIKTFEGSESVTRYNQIDKNSWFGSSTL